jgi:hypothetical protein
MMITIANILKSDLAIYHEEGLIVYEQLQEAYDKKEKISISFEGLTRCSTQFLNASVGKLYLLNDPKVVDSLLSYNFGDYGLMKLKTSEVRDNAINSKEYDKLVEDAAI